MAVQDDTVLYGQRIFIHGTKHIDKMAKSLLRKDRWGQYALVKHDPTNKWDPNTFNIFMFLTKEQLVPVGCVQRNLAQLLVKLGIESLAGCLMVGKDSYARDVFEIEIFGIVEDETYFLKVAGSLFKSASTATKSGFFDSEPDNDSAVEQEDN